MKAVVLTAFGGPEVLEYVDVEKPVPAAGEVLVQNHYIGVGKPDFVMRSGICPFLDRQPPGLICGNECVGIVEAVGEGVTAFAPGMRVCVNSGLGYGSHAEYIAVPQKFVTRLPDNFPLKYGTQLLNYSVAWAMLNDVGRGLPGQTIYITGGAGGIGTAVIQTALLQGMTVCASARSDEKCDYIRSLGAQCVFNSTKISPKDAILEFTEGRGADLIFDQLAGPGFEKQFEYLADFGTIVFYNWLEGSPEVDQLQTIISRSSHAQGVRSFSFHVYDDKPERRAYLQNVCMERIISGQIVPRLYKDLPLSEARYAHELLDGQKIMGKLVLHTRFAEDAE